MTKSAYEAEKKILSEKFNLLLPSDPTRPNMDQITAVTRKIASFMMAPMEEFGEIPSPENPRLAAGYTYLGQLLAHDLSSHRFFGAVPPALRLRTLYGMGPGMTPYLFEYKPLQESGLQFRGVKFSLESYKADFGMTVYDVPRYKMNPDKTMPERQHSIPLMADSRNDQNFILSQLFVKFVQVHNFLVDTYHDPSNLEVQGNLFKKASSVLIALYQSIILYDYLPKILFDRTLIEHLKDKSNFIFFDAQNKTARLSEIFTRAALRTGHSQVRQFYSIVPDREVLQVFGNGNDLRGFIRDTRRGIDWNLFFGYNGKKAIQSAKAFDHLISLSMSDLPFLRSDDKSLVEINLRQSLINFPQGLDFYGKLSECALLTVNEKKCTEETWNSGNMRQKMIEICKGRIEPEEVPLWLFLLLEAEIAGEGKKLGPLGSRIIAEQIMWALHDDEESILRAPQDFPVELFPDGPKTVTMAELIKWVEPGMTIQPAPTEEEEQEIEEGRRGAQPPESLQEDNQHYKGTELNEVDTLDAYKEPVRTLFGRSSILMNGFYDLTTIRDQDYEEQLKTGQYKEPGGKVKQQIRVYVSRRNILYNLGFNSEDPLSQEAGNAPVKGLMFFWGLSQKEVNNQMVKNLELIARRIGGNGKVPMGTDDTFYFSNRKWLVMPDNSCINEQMEPLETQLTAKNEMAKLVGQFIKDGFGTLKMTGLQSPIVIKREVLLRMLDIDITTKSYRDVDEVEFHLTATKGQDIITIHNLTLPQGDLTATVPSTLFFTLGLRSKASDNNVKTIYTSETTRPYPYWCYDD